MRIDKPLPQSELNRALELYNAGMSLDEICRRIERGFSRVKQSIAAVQGLRSANETRLLGEQLRAQWKTCCECGYHWPGIEFQGDEDRCVGCRKAAHADEWVESILVKKHERKAIVSNGHAVRHVKPEPAEEPQPNPYWFKRPTDDPLRYIERQMWLEALEPPPLKTPDGREIDL